MSHVKSNVPNFDQLADQLKIYARKGQYKKGADLAKSILKKYPSDFYFTYQYAKLLGDWADDLPEKRKKKLKIEAAKILKPLTKKLSGKTVSMRFGICLNYYYQTYSYKNMYNFGKRFASADRKFGYYAQALGSGLYAEKLHYSKSRGQSKKWAQKSIDTWGKYNLKSEAYYFPFYSLATSFIILNEPVKAFDNLKHAAKVSDRSVKCDEFKALYKLIQDQLGLKKMKK